MSLSFKDSLTNNAEKTVSAIEEVVAVNEDNLETATVMAYSLRSAPMLLADNDNWTAITDKGYRFYNGLFEDDGYSTVDEEKNIILDPKQFNITQEENSQYIPFRMPRYYDGFDLKNTTLKIYYLNANKDGQADVPVDVYYNDDYIKFAWLVSKFATQVAGILQFEIHANGEINANGETQPYTWKSKSIGKLNVLQSLVDATIGEIGVSNEQLDTWINKFEISIGQASEFANKSEAAAVRAENAAKSVTEELEETVGRVVGGTIGEAVKTEVSDTLKNYYTSAEINLELTKYATKDFVNGELDDIEDKIDKDISDAVKGINNKFGTLADTEGTELTVEQYVKQKVDAVDVSEELGDLGTNEDGTTKTVVQYVNEAIESQDITGKLGNYYTKSETYSKEEVDNALDNVSVDLTGYATETYVNNKTSAIATNTENISSLSTVVTDLQSEVNSIDKSPRLTYDVAYNDVEDEDVGENVFVFYEISGEGTEDEIKEAKKKFTIVGGGGTSTSSTLKIGYVTTSPLVVTTDDMAIITYTFSGIDSSGDNVPEGVATWKVAGKIVATNTALNGENSFDVTEHLSVGTQKVNLSITDEAGSLVTKTWTVQKIDVRLESTFNDTLTYPIGTVSFDYTPYGAISKDVHFILDGVEIGTVTTTSSGIPMAYELPAQEHGAHLLEVYMTATVNNNDIESNHIVKDIIWYDSTSAAPVISTVYQNFTARQYDTTNIEYTVYDPTTEMPTVEITVDGSVVSTPTLSAATNVYSYKTDVVGEHIITITCGETVKILTATITELNIDVEPVTAGLAFDFNPSGRSNNDSDRVWTDGTVSMSVSDNFDWVNGGYQYDESGDQYFCIKAGTSAEIDYQLFADDAKKNGKEFKLIFKTTNVAKPDATFLSCMDNTTGTDHIGIQMDVHEVNIYGQSGNLYLPYSEEDIIEFEFNISKNTEAVPMVMGYEDGVSTAPMVYDDSHNFTQNTPKVISLGSEDCDLHIYRFKVYNTSLTDRGILNNFIADARNAEEMISRYDRNQIYDENGQLTPEVLAEKCPWLRIIKIEAPYFTNNKSDKVPNTTIECIYKDGDAVLDNWIAYNVMHSGQGTSSNNYGAAGRNLDLIMNKSGVDGLTPYIVLGDGTEVSEVSLTRTSIPVSYFNIKVNIASSENANNSLLAKKYNTYNPYNRAFVREDGYDTSIIKDTMEFQNCVVFIKETNEDLSTHREFADNEWHYYAFGNMGDSKKTDETRLTDLDDPYECIIEIMDVDLPLSDFPTDTMINAMGYVEDKTTGVKTYTWAKDENLSILYELINGEYVLTEDTTVDLTKTYYVDILEQDDFSEDYTYGWRYISDDGDAEIVDYCKQKWIEAYRFITTSTDEEFYAGLGDYFVLDSVLYYYLFTTRYLMIDNRAKNVFIHYGKTGEIDADGNPIRKWDLSFDYDNDKKEMSL